jgi:antitoxin (DNA-binding transcriptional repressor) of toxin-antitoxin stability system
MTQYISQKELYGNLKKISDQVQLGTTFIVLKHSKPVYQITPLEEASPKKYQTKDLPEFIFTSNNNQQSNLAQNYKQYLYH